MASRGPFEIYELIKLFDQSPMGSRHSPIMGTHSAGYWSFEKDMILNCMIFVAPALHPIIYFVLNPEYRTGLTNAWKALACNQTPAQVSNFFKFYIYLIVYQICALIIRFHTYFK